MDLEHLFGSCVRFLVHAFKARATRLQVGYADSIFIGHPESKVARRLAQQRAITVTELSIKVFDRYKLVEIFGSVGDILIIGQPLNAGSNDRMTRRRKLCRDSGSEFLQGGTKPRHRRGCGSDFQWRRTAGRIQAGGKRFQAGFNRDSAALDCFFKLLTDEWQRSGGGKRTEESGTDNASVLFRKACEVEADERSGCVL